MGLTHRCSNTDAAGARKDRLARKGTSGAPQPERNMNEPLPVHDPDEEQQPYVLDPGGNINPDDL
jgi:hypothetical protein